jgi:hypothetical protein
MNVTDYNGTGDWGRDALLARYARYAATLGIVRRDLTPREHVEGDRRWVYPVMDKVIAGIEAGDAACARIGVEFIEQDRPFPFGKILKSNTAWALRRAALSDDLQHRIRRRVFGMLRAGLIPREFREYAKLVRTIGFDLRDLPDVDASSVHAVRFRSYFEAVSRGAHRAG